MSTKTFQTFQPEKCRPGILKGIETILDRIEQKESTTTIVLPPRYGKSNLMRATAIEAIERGYVGAVICLVPWLFLMEQLNSRDAITDMQLHHGMRHYFLPRPDILSGKIDPRFYKANPSRHWFVMTMGQAYQEATRIILADAATYFIEDERRPLLVFIDECHLTSSGVDGWGKLAQELKDAGAHIVLLTGTPERSDNISPFGFKTKEISRSESDRWVKNETTGEIENRVGEKVEYEVVPDVLVTLTEAWDQGIITKIDTSRFTYDMNEKDVSEESSIKVAKRSLALAVRDPTVINVAVNVMLKTLKEHRNNLVAAETTAIVFVGSDQVGDDGKDFECRQVKRIIEENWNHYFSTKPDIKIATSGNDNGISARNTIKKFVGMNGQSGIGDVIIVKQMGGVGLDAKHLKIALDLSTIRSKTSCTQRWLRVSTNWKKEVKQGIIILPDDAATRKLYNKIIKEKGGQYSYENESVIETKTIESNNNNTENTYDHVITNARRNGSVDMSMNRIDSEMDMQVDAVIQDFPILAISMTRVDIADLISKGALRPINRTDDKSQQYAVFDIAKEVTHRKEKINNLTKLLATNVSPYGQDPDKWKSICSKFMAKAKSYAKIEGELKQCRDIDKLNRAISYLEQLLRSEIS